MEEMIADFMNDDERPKRSCNKRCSDCIYFSGELKHGIGECFNKESDKEFSYLEDFCDRFKCEEN